ncbi:MAG: xanthine dehydrogenase family protein subunit M [Streptosporangiales bacterium]|nr:xanthine dehydrogenase family protein subunit M [Streptosporangiales bacterium]
MQVPAQVEYEKAASVADTLTLLERYGPVARILAGGHSLIPMMKLRLVHPEVLIDINGLSDLEYITVSPDGSSVSIGALTRHAGLLASDLVGEHFQILSDAERVIADAVVREWGTIGGSLCQADPSEDLSAAFAALKGSMIITGSGGAREVSAREFHTGPYETVVGPAEMLTEIRLPVHSGGRGTGTGSAYVKVSRRAGDWAVGAAGAWVRMAGGQIEDAGIGLAALGATHFVAAEAEEFLAGRDMSEDVLARAGQIAAENCHPPADQRGPADYKKHLAAELTARALRAAVTRARGRTA